MKTIEHLLAEFASMQRQIVENKFNHASCEVRFYQNEGFWDITLRVTQFNNEGIEYSECLEWTHHTFHRDDDETKNEAALSSFKKKFNLK